MILFIFISIQSFAQNEQLASPSFIFTPLKFAVGGRFGSFDNWNKQLDIYGYNTVNLKDELSFEFTFYHKNHLVLKSLISINKECDSTFIQNRKIDYKRRLYGVNVGYNIFSFDKISKWVIVPSIGFYTSSDKINCSSRLPINPYEYDVTYQTMYRYESGINPNLYISIDPFSNYHILSFLGVGIDIGAFYNMNWHHTYQYRNSLNGEQLRNDKQMTPYFKISFEPLRGLFLNQNNKHHKSANTGTSI
jgi:hypothetical protein